MSPVLAFLAALLWGYAAWQLWSAYARGEVLARYGGIVRRADQPIGFWVAVAVSALTLAAFTIILGLAAWRALAPPTLGERAGTYYPSKAVARNASGVVMLHCTVTEAYGVKDCAVVSEDPPGLGFAASALQISALDVIPRKDRAQARPGSAINLPIRFKMPDKQP